MKTMMLVVSILFVSACGTPYYRKTLRQTDRDAFYIENRWQGRREGRAEALRTRLDATQHCEMLWAKTLEIEALRVWYTGMPLDQTVAGIVFRCTGHGELRL